MAPRQHEGLRALTEAERARLQRQAAAAGLPYATLVGQRLYDLRGLADVLSGELDQARQAGDDGQVAAATRKLARCRSQIAAYEREG